MKADITFYIEAYTSEEFPCVASILKTENQDVKEVVRKNLDNVQFKNYPWAVFQNIAVGQKSCSGIAMYVTEETLKGSFLRCLVEVFEMAFKITGSIADDLVVEFVIDSRWADVFRHKAEQWKNNGWKKPEDLNRKFRVVYAMLESVKTLSQVEFNTREDINTKFTFEIAKMNSERIKHEFEKLEQE